MTIVVYLITHIPTLIYFFWIKNRFKKDDKDFSKICNKALFHGIICSFVIILLSGLFALIEGISGIAKISPIIRETTHAFIVLAFAEEFIKSRVFKNIRKNNSNYPYSWLDYAAIMMVVGMGFGLIEDLLYSFSTGPMVMVISGLTIAHGGYGFIMGYLLGKGKKNNKKSFIYLSFIIPWLMHGTYDFCLSEKVAEYLWTDIAFISLLLAVVSFITVFVSIHFFRKRRNDINYIEPLNIEIKENN